MFLHLLLFLLFINPATSQIPRNLIQEYIKTHADFSINPCDDFFSHVCPADKGRDFVTRLMDLEQDILKRHRKMYLGGRDTSKNATLKAVNNLKAFMNSSDGEHLCEYHPNIFYTLLENNVKNTSSSCSENVKLARESDFAILTTLKTMLSGGWEHTIVNMELSTTDKKVHDFYKELKSLVREEFKKTPWALNKKVLDKFVKALDELPAVTIADYRELFLKTLDDYQWELERCELLLAGSSFSSQVISTICDALAVLKIFDKMEAPKIWISDVPSEFGVSVLASLTQNLFAGNWEQNNPQNKTFRVLVLGTPMNLLANTDYPSDLYGGIGTVMIHEIMHSFVFHDKDLSDLKPFWSNDTDCVKKQMIKSCAMFPSSKCLNSSYTFEEDAADMAAYRLAWKAYQQSVAQLKSLGTGYESLNQKQLFFYSFATIFCQKWHTSDHNDTHSSFHHRINSVMSQMNEFSDVFQCKESDRMVQNRADYCVIYGEDAPETKMLGEKTNFF